MRRKHLSRVARLAALAGVPLSLATASLLAPGIAYAGAPYSCTTSSFTGACPASGNYTDPAIYGANGGNATVRNQIWMPAPGETSVMSANGLQDWQDVINVRAGNTSVTGWPDSQVTVTDGNNTPLSLSGNFTSLTSTLNLTMQSVPGAAYDNGWDVWGGVTGQSSTDYQYEMMIWTNQLNRGTCGGATVLTRATFGTQTFTLCQNGTGSTAEFIWYLSDASGNPVNQTSSSVDIYAMLQWMISHGYYPSNYGLNQITVGSEVCSTGGNNQAITLTGWTLTANGSGGTQQPPAVTTTAASGVTSSGATLNGTVNPEGASTTYQFKYGTTTNYGSVAPASPGSAGAGTTAVSESAPVTGLAASTTYHDQLCATNSAGTTCGADQQFTTSAGGGGGGTVSYVSAAPGSAGAKAVNTGTLSWTHTVSGTSPGLVAEVAVGISGSGDTGCSLTLKDGTNTMNQLAVVHANNQHSGYLTVFGLANPPAGANTLTATVTGCSGGTPDALTGGSLLFNGVSPTAPFGTAATAFGNSATASVSLTSTSASNMVAGFVANGSSISSATSPSTSRFIANQDNNTGASNSAGATQAATGAAQSLKWALQSDWWGAAAVQVQHT